MKYLLAKFCLTVLLFAVTPVPASDTIFGYLQDGREYYGVYDEQGSKIGYVEEYASHFTSDGRSYFVYTQEFEFSIYDSAEAIEYLNTSRWKYLFDVKNQFQLVQAWQFDANDSWSRTTGKHDGSHSHHSESSTVLTRVGDSIQVTRSSLEGDREWSIPAFSLTAYDFLAFYTFLRSNPMVGDRVEIKTIDFDELSINSEILTVNKISDMTLDGVKTKRYDCIYELPGLGWSGDCVGLGSGSIIKVVIGGIEFRKEPELIAKDIEQSVELLDYLFKPINVALPEHEELLSITIEVSGNDVEGVFVNSDNQVVEVLDSDHLIITLQRGVGENDSLGPDGSAEYLKRTPLYPVEHAVIKEIVKNVVGNLTSEEAKLDRLIAFVDDLIVDVYGADSEDVLEIASTKRGDCTEHTLLFVTLSRAAGIPAKQVTGYIYNEDSDSPGFVGHMWAEVLINGYWRQVDPTWGENPVSIRHLKEDSFGSGYKRFDIRLVNYRVNES